MQNKREQIRRILQLPPLPASAPATTPSTSGASSGSDDEVGSELDLKNSSVIGKSYGKRRDEDAESVVSVQFSNASVDPKAASDLEDAIGVYLRRATENFDLTKNVEVTFSNILSISYLKRFCSRRRFVPRFGPLCTTTRV